VFRAPLSPEAAGALEGARVALADFDLPAGAPIVVEGAGGVMVPLNGQSLMLDLMGRLGLPVVVVAGTGLGTINHTLLSLAALRARGVAVAGVVLVGAENEGNRDAIVRHGTVRVIGWVPWLTPVTATAVAAASAGFPAWQDVVDSE
jgi:malonyl-CoA O-methyltransferase